MRFLKVPEGRYRIGTTHEGIQKCVEQWRSRLINPCYDEASFREWIEKEFPAHEVVSRAFELQQTPVSHADIVPFLEEMQADVRIPESVLECTDPNLPVWGVSMTWANQFIHWLNRRDKEFRYRLPTETEWEIAARGSDFREYPYGHEFNPNAANTVESDIGRTTPVDRYERYAGPFGHCDLAGNVEEWVATKYYVYPGGKPIRDHLFEKFGLNYNILRGGNFRCGGDLTRSARRHGPFPDPIFRYTGFRLVREAKES